MRTLVGLVVLLVLGAAGIKGYLWYSVKSEVDELVERIAPFADVEYDGIYTSLLESTVGVEGLTVQPRMLRETITVESIRYDAPDMTILYATQRALRQNQVPTTVGFEISGLSLSTDGRVFRELMKGGNRSGPLEAVFGSRCVGGEPLDVSDLQFLGYDHMVSDINLTYEIDPAVEEMSTRMRWAIRRMAEIEGAMTFSMDPGDLSFRQTAQAEPGLVRGSFSYVDRGYNLGVNNLCAVETDVDVDVYLERRVDAAAAMVSELGARPDGELQDAYRKFAAGSGELQVAVDPDRPLKLANLGFYRPDDVIRMLNPTVTIDGLALTLTPAAPESQEALSRSGAAEETDAGEVETDSPPSEDAGSPGFRVTAVRGLAKYQGSRVRIVTDDGRHHEGRLHRLAEGTVHLEKRFQGGEMVYPIPAKGIRSAEVYR